MRYLALIGILVLFFQSCDSPTRRLRSYDVHGVDVSHFQSKVAWEEVVKQDIHFAFVKATEGETLQDSMFCENWEGTKRVGLRRGAYHFYRPKTSARNQAENFAMMVNLEVGDLPPVLDVEVLDDVSKVELINGIRTWLYLIEIKYDIKPIIYTNLKFYYQHLAGHFDDYPMWIARYNYREPLMATGSEWDFWQYGNRGQVEGIQGDVDLNVFNGSLEELDQLCLAPRRVLSSRFPQ
jgi:lysozyme